MNLICEIHNYVREGEYAFMILREYSIITLVNQLVSHEIKSILASNMAKANLLSCLKVLKEVI